MPSTLERKVMGNIQVRIPQWFVYALLTIVFWGTWGATSKIVSDNLDAYLSQVLFTVGLCPLMLIILLRARPKSEGARRRGIFYAFLTGVLGGTGNIAFFQALGMGGKASVVVPMTAMSPLVTVLMALVFLRERVSAIQAVGLLLAGTAIYLLGP